MRKWDAADGIDALFEKCAPSLLPHAPHPTSDSEVQALLDSIRKRSATGSVDIGLGLVLGLLIGAAFALPIGLTIAEREGFDSIRAAMLSLAIGGVSACVAGGSVEAILRGRIVARRMARNAYLKYQLDPAQFTRLAESYPRRIRNAVRHAAM